MKTSKVYVVKDEFDRIVGIYTTIAKAKDAVLVLVHKDSSTKKEGWMYSTTPVMLNDGNEKDDSNDGYVSTWQAV